MKKTLAGLMIGLLMVLACTARAATTSTITGTVQNIDGTNCANCTVTFNSMVAQTINGTTYQPLIVSSKTDSSGNLSSIALPQGLAVSVRVSENGQSFQPYQAIVPFISAVTFNQLNQGILTNPLNVLASQQPPTGPLSMNSQKITSLACPASNGDALAWGCNASVNNLTVTGGFTQNTSGMGIFGAFTDSQIANPSAPTVVAIGTTGATTYYYFEVCHDGNNGTTLASASGSITNSNATLTSSNYNQVNFTLPTHALNCDTIRNTANTTSGATAVIGCQALTASPCNDQNNSTNAYTIPGRNTTGDGQFAGFLTAAGLDANTIQATGSTPTLSGYSINGVINVKAYGAAGDGVTNDLSAVLSAVEAACPNGMCVQAVYFPEGTYLLSSNTSTSVLSLNTSTLGSTGGCVFNLHLFGPGGRQPNYQNTGGVVSGPTARIVIADNSAKIGLDMLGVGNWDIHGIEIEEPSSATGPVALMATGKTTTCGGTVGAIYDAALQTYAGPGTYAWVNLGGENYTAWDFGISASNGTGSGSGGGIDQSANNTIGLTSTVTIQSAPISMTLFSILDANSFIITNGGATSPAYGVYLDDDCNQITNHTYDNYFQTNGKEDIGIAAHSSCTITGLRVHTRWENDFSGSNTAQAINLLSEGLYESDVQVTDGQLTASSSPIVHANGIDASTVRAGNGSSGTCIDAGSGAAGSILQTGGGCTIANATDAALVALDAPQLTNNFYGIFNDTGATPAQTGVVRLTQGGGIFSRNHGNTADAQMLVLDGSNNVLVGDPTNSVAIIAENPLKQYNGDLFSSLLGASSPPTATFADGTHCGASGSITSTSTNNSGEVTMGTTVNTTACPITFATGTGIAPTSKPFCVVQDLTNPNHLTSYSESTTTLTINGSTLQNDVVDWWCGGKG